MNRRATRSADNVIEFDPDAPENLAPWLRIEGEPPIDDDARRAYAAYRRLVELHGSDRRGLPNPGPTMRSLTVICDAGQRGRGAHPLARVYAVEAELLFVGVLDYSRGTAKSGAETLRTIAFVKVAARFLSAVDDQDEYPVKCTCSLREPTCWLSRERLRHECTVATRRGVVQASAVQSR